MPKSPPPKKHRIFTMPFAKVYPFLVAKAEKKGRTKAEVDEIIRWLTGYTAKGLEKVLKAQTDFETFFAQAPKKNPKRKLITGLICGYRVEEIDDPLMREIRYLDKLIDELAKGKAMEKILRTRASQAEVGGLTPRSKAAKSGHSCLAASCSKPQASGFVRKMASPAPGWRE